MFSTEKKQVWNIFFLSILAILWWRSAWALLDDAMHFLAGGSQARQRILNLAVIILVVATFFYHPQIMEAF